ncbi:MAG: SUMF1/EgtB/PvdO family nonheme iron enzyme, partial [Thermoguttaceae bacterium]|nr:SUMF1/EgtB/PvdO family nonheme iron enzyme [Thermoguttaceae bacterium]
PKGPSLSTTYVCRGGSWRSPAERCRSASRLAAPEDYRASDVGFRLAIVAD